MHGDLIPFDPFIPVEPVVMWLSSVVLSLLLDRVKSDTIAQHALIGRINELVASLLRYSRIISVDRAFFTN